MTRVISVAAGDTNLRPRSRQQVAEAAGAVLLEGRGVDCLFVTGVNPRAKTATRVLGKGGSDHPPIVHEIGAARVLVVVQWNVYVGQSPLRVGLRVARLIRKYRPAAVMLQEAYRCGPRLRKVADRYGYVVIQGENVGEGADCALLLRGDRPVKWTGAARMRQAWRGLAKHGHPPRQPRVYPRGRVEVADGIDLRAMSIHFPTASPGNKVAVEESIRRTVNWLRKGHR